MVTRGFNQTFNVDIINTFAPSPFASGVKIVGAVASELIIEFSQLDVKQEAFIQAD